MRILYIEDERKVAEMVSRGLRAERYAVDVAENGDTGWAMAHTYAYDLVILDLGLPGMDGTELLRRIRGRDARIPILILTARDATSSKVENIEAGADDYMTKPFAFAELAVRVKALLRRGPSNQSNVVRVGDLEMDRLTQQVRRGGKRIDLTPKEYALLDYLASHPGRVLSRTMIVEQVWDQSFEGLTNIVDVYVRHLRAKVDEIKAEAAKVDQLEGTISELQRQKDLDETSYKYYATHLVATRIDEALGSGHAPNVAIVQSPTPPWTDWTGTQRLMAKLAGGGIALGIAWALLNEFFLQRLLRRPDDDDFGAGGFRNPVPVRQI